jgi:predicted TIM-barrel fold metal-dependent hydrolase
LVLARARRIHFDLANAESVGGLAKMVQRIGPERVLFGTHFPLFYPESSFFKIRESALKDEEVQAIQLANARALLTRS